MPAYLTGFKNRVKLTVDNTKIDGDLTDFPVAIQLSDSAGISSFDARRVFEVLQINANRKKIAITTADGSTQCPVEIEYWDQHTKVAVLHAKIPNVGSSADTVLYLYFDNSAADNTGFVGDTGDAAAQNVWDANFAAVWHMSQDPSGGAGAILDSTGNTRNGTPDGTMLTEDLVDGVVGGSKALDLDGSDDNISFTSETTYPTEEITIEAVFKSDAADDNCLITQDDGSGTSSDLFNLYIESNQLRFGMRTDVAGFEEIPLAFTDTVNWNYVAGKKPIGSSKSKLGLNGTALTESTTAFTMKNSGVGTVAKIGVQAGNGARDFDGKIGEVRISNIARSDAWIKATYHALFDTLVTLSDFESTEFKKRRKITIDSSLIDATLTDFPLAISLSTTAGIGNDDLTDIFDELDSNANRFKIKVTLDDLETECPIEIEYFDVATKKGVLHTKIPSVSSSTDTNIYLHYDRDQPDNPNAGDPGDTIAQNVWDANFAAVWHLAQDPSGGAGAILDSTSNGNNGTASNMEAGDLSDGALTLDGTNEYINIPNDTGFTNVGATDGDYTVETLFSTTQSGASFWYNNPRLIEKRDYGTNNRDRAFGLYLSGNKLAGVIDNEVQAGNPTKILTSTGDVNDGNDHHAALVKSGTTLDLFVDYSDNQTDTIANVDYSSPSEQTIIGARYNDSEVVSADYYSGKIGEVRISTTARPDAWIKATYYTLFDSLLTWDVQEGPWLGSWAYRRRFTISSSLVDTELRDFPVALFVDASCGIGATDLSGLFTELSTANKKKMAVTLADKVTECYFEIENWDSTNSKGLIHVKVPKLEATRNTEIYLYYDSGQADNSRAGVPGDAVAQNVWDDDFVGVWHMNQDPSGGAGAILDSTSNGNDGTSAGTMLTEDLVDGQVGKGIDFNGSQWIDCGADSSLDVSDYTLEAIFEGHLTAVNEMFAGRYDDDNNDSFGLRFTAGELVTGIHKKTVSNAIDSAAQYTSGFQLAQLTFEAGVGSELWMNGSSEGSDATTTVAVASYVPNFYIAAQHRAGTERPFTGTMDEVRLSDIARSDAWILVTYRTLFDLLGTWGAEEVTTSSDVYAIAGTPAEISFIAQAATVGASAIAGTPAEITWTVLAAIESIGVDAGTPQITFSALSVAIVQNLDAIGIMSKPNVSAKGPDITATGKQPNITAAGAGPSITVTAKGD